MGAKPSKPKKYNAKDMFQRTNWDDEDNVLDRNREAVVPGDMDGPYQSQGEPDAYINFCQSDAIDNDAVWQRRTSYEDLISIKSEYQYLYMRKKEDATLVRSELYVEPTELVETIETVFDGPDHRGENDIYEEPKFLHESFFNKGSPLPLRPARRSPSETNIKQTVDTCEIATVNKYIDFSSSVKQQRQLHRYEEMVLIFEPLILKNVIARQIIPHLTFLDDPEKVRVIAERDQRAAVVCIIDELRTNHTDPGRWKQFIEALERCGYSNIAGVLRGEKPEDHTYHRQYLKLMTPELRDNIASPLDLTEVLWSANVLSDEDKEEIQQTHERFGVLAANDRLLDRVPRKHKYWYSHLIDCLRNTNMTHAADMLDIPELRSLSVYNDAYLKPQNSKLGPETAGENTHKRPSTKQFKDLHNTICKRKLNDDEYDIDEQMYGELPTDSTSNYILTEQTITSEHSKGSKKLVGEGTDELSEAYDESLAYDAANYDDVQYNLPPPPIPPLSDGSQENSHSNGTDVGGSNDSQTKVHIESTSSQLTSSSSSLYNNTTSVSSDNNNATTINNNSASKTEKGEVAPPIVIRPKNIQTEEYEEYSDPDDDRETLLSSEVTDRPPFALTPLPSWIKERPLPQPPTELPLPSWSTKLRVPTPPPGGSNSQPDTPTTPPPVPDRLPLIQNIDNLNELSSIEDFDDGVVVIRSPPTEIGIPSPFPEPFVDCSKRNKTQHNSRTDSFNKRPVPLPRQRVLTTGVNTSHEKEFGQIEEEFEDDGYTEPDENPTPVIGEDNTDKVEVNGKGANDKEQPIVTRPEEHIWGYVEPRNKKCRVKYPSQKTKKKYKRLAQSRKKKGGINFRKFFHMKELKTTKEEEPEKGDAQPVSIDDKKEPPRRSVRSKICHKLLLRRLLKVYFTTRMLSLTQNEKLTKPLQCQQLMKVKWKEKKLTQVIKLLIRRKMI